ncbi:MAG: hypothetical protein ACXVHR_04210 [Methanobacterium sp.]
MFPKKIGGEIQCLTGIYHLLNSPIKKIEVREALPLIGQDEAIKNSGTHQDELLDLFLIFLCFNFFIASIHVFTW